MRVSACRFSRAVPATPKAGMPVSQLPSESKHGLRPSEVLNVGAKAPVEKLFANANSTSLLSRSRAMV